MKTYLSKEVLAKLNTEEETAAYTALKIEFDQMLTLTRDEVIVKVTVDSLNYNLFGSLETERYNKAKLEKGLQSIIDMGLVRLISKGVKGFYILDIKGLEIKGKKQEYEKDDESEEVVEAYTMMEVEEIWKIMSIDFKQKFNLLRLAVAVFGTFNNCKKKCYYKCGFSSVETLMELSHIRSNKTVIEMLKVFEENGIIYVRHSDKYTVDGDVVKKVTNVYSRPCDKAYADDYYESRFTKRTASEKPVKASQKAVEEPQKNSVEEPVKVSEEPVKEPEKPVEEQKKETSKPAKEFNFTPIQYTKEQLEAIERYYGKKSKLTYGEVDDDEEQLA